MNILIIFAIIQVTWTAAIVEKRSTCNHHCAAHWDPVCGSDGRTYATSCLLSIATCKDHSIHKAHDGACSRKRDVVPCSPDMMCYAVYDPVCGSDGKTYSNDCVLLSLTCGKNVTIVQKGAC